MNKKTHIRNVIAGNVKKYRKLRQLTQENLAELADVSNTYIANIECGQTWISDKTVEKIATALHIEEYMLFIPDEEIISDSDNITKKQKMIEFLKLRENALCSYISDFFSETFEHIVDSN